MKIYALPATKSIKPQAATTKPAPKHSKQPSDALTIGRVSNATILAGISGQWREEAAQILENADFNGDGFLSRWERSNMLDGGTYARIKMQHIWLDHAFGGRGEVSLQDILWTVQSYIHDGTLRIIDEMVRADWDRSGTIDLWEFRRLGFSYEESIVKLGYQRNVQFNAN